MKRVLDVAPLCDIDAAVLAPDDHTALLLFLHAPGQAPYSEGDRALRLRAETAREAAEWVDSLGDAIAAQEAAAQMRLCKAGWLWQRPAPGSIRSRGGAGRGRGRAGRGKGRQAGARKLWWRVNAEGALVSRSAEDSPTVELSVALGELARPVALQGAPKCFRLPLRGGAGGSLDELSLMAATEAEAREWVYFLTTRIEALEATGNARVPTRLPAAGGLTNDDHAGPKRAEMEGYLWKTGRNGSWTHATRRWFLYEDMHLAYTRNHNSDMILNAIELTDIFDISADPTDALVLILDITIQVARLPLPPCCCAWPSATGPA